MSSALNSNRSSHSTHSCLKMLEAVKHKSPRFTYKRPKMKSGDSFFFKNSRSPARMTSDSLEAEKQKRNRINKRSAREIRTRYLKVFAETDPPPPARLISYLECDESEKKRVSPYRVDVSRRVTLFVVLGTPRRVNTDLTITIKFKTGSARTGHCLMCAHMRAFERKKGDPVRMY